MTLSNELMEQGKQAGFLVGADFVNPFPVLSSTLFAYSDSLAPLLPSVGSSEGGWPSKQAEDYHGTWYLCKSVLSVRTQHIQKTSADSGE